MTPGSEVKAPAARARNTKSSGSRSSTGGAARKRAQPRKSAAKPGGARPATAKSASSKGGRARTATVNLPFVTAEFRAPEVHLPSALSHPSLGSVPLVSRVPPLVSRVPPLVNRVPRPRVVDAAGQQLAGVARVVGPQLPDRDQLALYGGLGAAAAVGILDWPVAAAVAAGTLASLFHATA
jgi:hypothetical protein